MSSFWKKGSERPTRHVDPDEAIARYLEQLHQADVAGASPPASALNGLGDAYLDKGDVASAVDYYHQAAEIYAREGMHTNAIACLKKVRRHAADEGDAGLLLGRYYAAKKLIPDALAELDVYADRQRGMGNRKRALEAMQEAVRLVPGDAERRERLGDVHLHEGQGEAAVGAYREAWRIFRDRGRTDAVARLRTKIEDAGGEIPGQVARPGEPLPTGASAGAGTVPSAPSPEAPGASETPVRPVAEPDAPGTEPAARRSPTPPPDVEPDESDLAPRPAGAPHEPAAAGPVPREDAEADLGAAREEEPAPPGDGETGAGSEVQPAGGAPPGEERSVGEAPPPAEPDDAGELSLDLEIERTSYEDQEREAIRRAREAESEKLTVAQQTSSTDEPVERAEIQDSTVGHETSPAGGGVDEAGTEGASGDEGAGDEEPGDGEGPDRATVDLDGFPALADAAAELERAALDLEGTPATERSGEARPEGPSGTEPPAGGSIIPEPRSHEDMVALAEQHLRTGEIGQAGKYLRIAAEGLREDREWHDAAHAYRRLAEIGEADGEDFEDWIECARQTGRASEVLEALSTTARWHLEQGDVPAARRSAEEMFLVDPDSETATAILERIGPRTSG